MRKTIFCTTGTLLVLLLAVPLTSCQTKLTRAKAQALLDPWLQPKEGRINSADEALLEIGRYGDCDGNGDSADPARNAYYSVLAQTGYITDDRIKPGLWNVQLTPLGAKAIAGEKYGHEIKGPCDYWQVTVPLVKYDHYTITGIVSDETHATADIRLVHILTPVAVATVPLIEAAAFQADKAVYGESLARQFNETGISSGGFAYRNVLKAQRDAHGKLQSLMKKERLSSSTMMVGALIKMPRAPSSGAANAHLRAFRLSFESRSAVKY
jgi:hypothetical protein